MGILLRIFTLCLLFFPMHARAGTLTFDQIDCAGDTLIPFNIKEFGVTWSEYNYYSYGWCSQSLLLGDDGWSSSNTITGNDFSVQAFDWVGDTDVTDPKLPFLTAEGYRYGTLVAVDVIFVGDLTISDFGGRGEGTRTLSNFVGLDEFSITMNQTLDGQTPACLVAVTSGYQCGLVEIDNIVVNAVPVPASLPLLLGAIGLLWGGARRRPRPVG